MPTGTTQPNSLVPATQQSPGNVQTAANAMRYNSANSADASLWYSAGDAVSSIKSQLDQIWNSLKQTIPVPDPIQVFSPNGSMIAEIGDLFDSTANQSYQGIWANNAYFGGSGPSSAEFIVTPAGITIDNLPITDTGPNGTIFIDPSVPDITITSSASGNPEIILTTAALGAAGPTQIVLSAATQGMIITNGSSDYIVAIGNLSNIFPAAGLPSNTIGMWTENVYLGGPGPANPVITCLGSTASIEIVSGLVTVNIDGTNFITVADTGVPSITQMSGAAVATLGIATSLRMGAKLQIINPGSYGFINSVSGELYLSNSRAPYAVLDSIVEFTGILSPTASAGAATLPSNPLGFIVGVVNGGEVRFPYYSP
jgi:hypothetical protein